MAKWKLVSKHEWEFASALPGYVKPGCSVVLGLAVAGLGVATIAFDLRGETGLGLFGGGLVFFGLIPLALGVLLFPWQRVAWVKVYEQGLRWKAWGRVHERHWDEVKQTRSADIQAIDQTGSRNEWHSSAWLVVLFLDGSSVTFDTALSDYGRLVRSVREARKRAAGGPESLP
ncbi:MAG: hypothetical protein ACRC33_25555 [Gemmataceae bacterium]